MLNIINLITDALVALRGHFRQIVQSLVSQSACEREGEREKEEKKQASWRLNQKCHDISMLVLLLWAWYYLNSQTGGKIDYGRCTWIHTEHWKLWHFKGPHCYFQAAVKGCALLPD